MPGSGIATSTGIIFDPLHPREELVDIQDIAHALSHQCRFAGHVRKFYSVAEHCVRASFLVVPRHALWALMHDATETYLVDMPSPLKSDPAFGAAYRRAEKRLMKVIARKYGLYGTTVPVAVHRVDVRLLVTERRDLMPWTGSADETALWQPWLRRIKPYDEIIVPWTSRHARATYLHRFDMLTRGSS